MWFQFEESKRAKNIFISVMQDLGILLAVSYFLGVSRI
jgi:hypothetical protein